MCLVRNDMAESQFRAFLLILREYAQFYPPRLRKILSWIAFLVDMRSV